MVKAVETAHPERLQSLDVFRGVTIAAMVLVNDAGSWEFVCWPLRHASWHGWTPTDLVFPFFLFIVGAAMAYSLPRYLDQAGRPTAALFSKVFRRAGLLILIGLLFNSAPRFDLEHLRLAGVLQRIGLCYLIAALLVSMFRPRTQLVLAGLCLIGYWALLVYVRAPDAPSADPLSKAGCVVGFVDRAILGRSHLLSPNEGFDPEGLLSTLPAIVTTLMGYWAALVIKARGVSLAAAVRLGAIGLACAALGLAWDWAGHPINKNLWTSSYVLLTGGCAMAALGACLVIVDVQRIRAPLWAFRVLGLNAILVFVGSGLLARLLSKVHFSSGSEKISLQQWLFQGVCPGVVADPYLASLLYALLNVMLWFGVAVVFHRRRWYVKL